MRPLNRSPSLSDADRGFKARVEDVINLRERNDYYTPSRSLFCDHCEQVSSRYRLSSGLVKREELQDIDYGQVTGVSIDGQMLFTVTTGKVRRYAKTVVLAVGPANSPQIPRLRSLPLDETYLRQACHGMQIKEFPDPVIMARMNAGHTTKVLVVGGGLTSAQLSDLAIRRGVTKVWHIMRGPRRIKHFDVDLKWMGKYKNAEQARFWTADSDEERLQIIKEAHGGGSITPLFNKRLKKNVAAGRLEILENTRLLDAKLEESDSCDYGSNGWYWTVQADPPVSDLPAFDYIYFATGIRIDFRSLPYLHRITKKYSIEGCGGFPCVNEDLM